MTIPASANLAAIVNGAVPDASKVNGELAYIESRALDAGATAGDTMQGPLNYGVDSGAANAYVVNPSPALASLVTGNEVTFKVVNANTGASTLNVSSLGVKNILKYGNVALVAGDLPAGAIVTARYDGTAWQLLSPQRNTVPLARMQVDEQGAGSSAAWTVGGVTATLAPMTVAVGDRILIPWFASSGNSATGAQDHRMYLIQSAGTGGGVWTRAGGQGSGSALYVTIENLQPSTSMNNSGMAYLLVTQAGTITLQARGLVATTTATVSSIEFSALVLRGT